MDVCIDVVSHVNLRAYLENLVRGAYQNWKSLEEVDVDEPLNEMPLRIQGT